MKKLFGSLLIILTLLALPLYHLSTAHALGPNLISNPSLETPGNPTSTPQNWHQDSWGTNNATFQYPGEGRTGSRSVKTTITSYTDGDAKWYFKPVTVSPGVSYTYSTYYKAAGTSEIVIQTKNTSGTASYHWLKTAPAANDWAQVSAEFTMPAGSSIATIFHVINGVGWLQIDDAYFGTTGTVTPPPPPPPDSTLIQNHSMETADPADGQKPLHWTSNAWGGTTAAFTYEQSGQQGSRSVKSTVTAHTDGDAKWYFEPTTINPNKSYTYKHFYKANVSTELVAAYIDTQGSWSYEWLQTLPAADGWQQLSANFATPANATKATLFHVIDKVGWVQIDNASLGADTAPPDQGPIPNPSLETANGSNPAGWLNNSWGTNTSNFEYLNEGRTGSHSVKVTVSNHQSGDGKWYFEPTDSLTPGQSYSFTAWYKTNSTPEAVAMFVMADGSERYFGMPDPQPASNAATTWQKYTGTFNVPEGAVGVSAFLFMNKNGWLQTDDYSIAPYQPTGFNRPLVTLTFDDGEEDNVDTALPVMNTHGFKSTQCFATEFIEGNQTQINRVLQFRDAGHEICSHTVTHPFLTSLGASELDHELKHSQQYLQSITGAPVRNFASPYGDYNATVIAAIDNYYRSHRSVDEGYNSKDNFNIYRLRVQNMLDTTTLAEFQSWLDEAKATNTWLILVYHRVADDPGPYDTKADDFQSQMNALDASGITVKTYDSALDEITGQL